jgi:hypothetical protein
MLGQAIGSRSRRAVPVIASVLALAATMLLGARSAAAAEAPRWEVTAVTTPTNVDPGAPLNEVQRVTVDAAGGSFTLAVQPRNVGGFPVPTAALPYDATAAEVQAALAAISGIGGEGVSVTGGPGDSSPYEVTFEGEDAAYPIELMQADGSDLTGGAHSVTVDQIARGAVPPQLVVTATNVGGAATDGSTIDIGDALPSGVSATNVTGFDVYASAFGFEGQGGAPLSCAPAPAVSCAYTAAVDPGDQLMMYVTLQVAASGLGATNRVTVAGGGASEASFEAPFTTGTTPAAYGATPGSVFAALSSMQAGAHPDLTTQFTINTSELNVPSEDTRDIRFDLPPGLVGSAVGTARCSMSRVVDEIAKPDLCPTDSMVGVAALTISPLQENRRKEAQPGAAETIAVPIYNIAPSPGEPAAFGFDAIALPVRLDTSVLSNGDYGVRVTAPEIPETLQTISTSITIWGVPAQHNGPGGDMTFYSLLGGRTFGAPNPNQSPVPLLTSPQQCTEPLTATMETDPWVDPGVFSTESASMGKLTDCDLVPFSSSFSFLPDTLEAGAPAGYTFDLNVPQQNVAGALTNASVKSVKLTLPEGVVVNPSAAQGLSSCSDAEFYGPHHPSQEPASPAECPREAQVGEVEVETPDLEHPLKGEVFLGAPECDPCTPQDAEGGKMVRLFVQLVGEGEAGVIVKLEGRGMVDQQTGQITTVFEETPQVPFNRLRLVLEGGPRAVLANPRVCGPVKATGDLTPWNTEPGVSDSTPFYEFEIDQGCFGSQFAPSFAAGMPNIQAGAFGEFTLAFGRGDRDQYLGGITTRMPAGLLGKLAGVELCKEAQANAGTCGANSSIGQVQVLTGPGTNPFLVSGGQVFLTEGYDGAPFGLSIVVPAVAGPYTLSGTTGAGTVVVRAKIAVDPSTAALTVSSNPLPTMLDGIPLQLKAVDVRIDRPGFTFNPTNCARTAIAGTLSSAEGMSASASSPFQVTNCASLGFKPSFTAATSGKSSRANGASLGVKLAFPAGGQGSEANIAKVKVELPKQLPSRLTTLQKACPAAQFEANPADCPQASVVGHASAITPIVPVPLTGPAYFVSHGGEAFPSLVVVLQGYGVTVDLVGTTFISKSGITSSTFKTVPDVPVSSFELSLPEGPFSALAANGDLCTSKLAMPTEFVAQNGAEVKQSTSIAVTGCKPAIEVIKRSVEGKTATIVAGVPAAGRLVASGAGLTRAVAKAGAAGSLTVRLTLTESEQRFLSRHRGRELRSSIGLRFTPKHGATLSRSVTVLLR